MPDAGAAVVVKGRNAMTLDVETADGANVDAEDEIEITPEMIEAGARVLLVDVFTKHLSPGLARSIAEDTISAALKAAPRKLSLMRILIGRALLWFTDAARDDRARRTPRRPPETFEEYMARIAKECDPWPSSTDLPESMADYAEERWPATMVRRLENRQ